MARTHKNPVQEISYPISKDYESSDARVKRIIDIRTMVERKADTKKEEQEKKREKDKQYLADKFNETIKVTIPNKINDDLNKLSEALKKIKEIKGRK